jgi:ribosomal protein L11 methyltransferase
MGVRPETRKWPVPRLPITGHRSEKMAWLAISIDVDGDRVEALSDALIGAGAIAVDVADAAAGGPRENPLFAEPGSAARRWQHNRVTALFSTDADLAVVLPAALHSAGLPEATPYGVDPVQDQDWVRVTQGQFLPQQISRRLWIVPSWHAAPDPRAINIVLDPGLAFGTGSHPTTRLCLRWLDRHVRGGESVIDFGCGSGILCIAALKLGASSACGVDVDEQALLAARHNAMQNQVSARFFAAADRLEQRAQIVIANILANPLRVLAPLLARLTEAHGRVVLAGILDEQADEVREAYQPWFDMDTVEREDGWVLLSGVRR